MSITRDFVNDRELSEQEQERYQKLKALESKDLDVYGRNWDINFTSKHLRETFESFTKDQLSDFHNTDDLNNKNIVMAGRVMTKRQMGKKSIFAHLQDQYGQFQIYLKFDEMDETIFNDFADYSDLGDIYGVKGCIMKTDKGELTLKVQTITILAKALRPLPDKYHGLSDIEERYRRRYVDLIINPESKEVFIKRSKVMNELRSFLTNKGCLEVETPILQEVYGGAAARPFKTFHNTLKMDLYLRIATELHLKRLIVGGFEGVYEIGRLFRNEGISPKHNPEFTTIEIYLAYKDVNFMMDFTEECIKHLVIKVAGTLNVQYEENNLNFAKPWARISMIEAVKNASKVDFQPIVDKYTHLPEGPERTRLKDEAFQEAAKIAKDLKIHIPSHYNSPGHLINLFFEEFVEKDLIQPTFICQYPVEISPLAKLSLGSLDFTDRFELFIGGREYANGYSELNNPIQQFERFKSQLDEKARGNDEASEMDMDFVEALEYGMPPTAGLGIGLDRLVMLITNQSSIKDVLLFPQMKPRGQ